MPEDYKIYNHNSPVTPKKGRPTKYWDQCMNLKKVDQSFFVAIKKKSLDMTIWRYNRDLRDMGSGWKFKHFSDTEFKCPDCKHTQLWSQMTEGGRCIKCNEANIVLKRRGTSIQRIS